MYLFKKNKQNVHVQMKIVNVIYCSIIISINLNNKQFPEKNNRNPEHTGKLQLNNTNI